MAIFDDPTLIIRPYSTNPYEYRHPYILTKYSLWRFISTPGMGLSSFKF